MKTLFLLLAALSAYGQATLSWTGPSTIKVGQVATISVSTGGSATAAQQHTINAPVDVASVAVTATAPGKTAYCGAFATAKITCLILSQTNSTAIPAGPLLTIAATFKSTFTLTQESFSLTGSVAADPLNAAKVTVTPPSPFVILPDLRTNSCDVDANGSVTGADTQIVVDVARGTATPPAGSRTDHNGDGATDIADAMISVLVSLGQLTCP